MIDYLPIGYYLRILYKRRWIIIGIIVAGLLAGIVRNWTAIPIFEAYATLQIDVDPNVLGIDRPLVPLDQRDWMREFLPTQFGILQSRELARIAYNELKLSTEGHPSAGVDHQLPTVAEIAADRTVSMGKDSRLVNIGFRSADPVVASQVANALARAYVKQHLQFRSRTTGDASDWLAHQVQEQRKLVEASEAALQRYRLEHGADALMTDQVGEQRQNIVVQKLAELQDAATKARTDTIEKEARYKQVLAVQANQQPLDTVPAIASNAVILALKTDLTTSQRQLVQASKELGDRHPEIIRLQAAVQDAERQLQTEISKVVGVIQNELEADRSREHALILALERQKGEVRALNAKAVEYTALEREANSNREVLDKLLQRSREASLARELQSSNVRIVDQAEIPDLPILPHKERTLIMAFSGSGALALSVVLLLEILSTRISSPDDVERHLGIPVLGVAPRIKRLSGDVSLFLGNGAPPHFAELLNGVRTSLLSTPELASGRTLLVTSAEPAEGKTLAAANLAASFARLNQRVLLIDADLRQPRLHEIFGVERQPGLSDVLTENATAGALRKTNVAGLSLIPAGSTSRNPADLLSSEGFRKLIDSYREQFDWIVLDSPPALAVTDPCLIARVASGVLLVVGCDQTSRQVASAAVERLDAVGACLVGAILNRAVLSASKGSYLPYYHRDYQTYTPQREASFLLPEAPNALHVTDSGGTGAPLS